MTILDQPRNQPRKTGEQPQPQRLWSSMPGWGIVTNLLPPEVISARRLRALRKVIALVLLAILVLAGAGYGYGSWRAHRASSALGAEQQRTVRLTEQQQNFADVVRIQGTIAQLRGRLRTLLTDDVDFAVLIRTVLAALPPGSSVMQLALALTTADAQGVSGGTDMAVLDTSGHPHIGTVTVTGKAHNLDQVAAFVSAVAKVPGVVEAVPTSEQGDRNAVQFTVDITLSDAVRSRYAATTGGK